MIWRALIAIPWIVFLVYWTKGALRTKRTVETESRASRLGILSLEIVGFLLLFIDHTRVGILDHRFLPRTVALATTGVILTWAGIGIAIWARWHLGQNWSARVTLKEGHELIRTGPYAHFRHPIYSGLDLAVIGSALAIDETRCLLGVLLIMLGYWIKAKREESMLLEQFGEAFREHCRHTGFPIPKF